eukprot:6175376-Pleurochrysis_carterae.AAC.7
MRGWLKYWDTGNWDTGINDGFDTQLCSSCEKKSVPCDRAGPCCSLARARQYGFAAHQPDVREDEADGERHLDLADGREVAVADGRRGHRRPVERVEVLRPRLGRLERGDLGADPRVLVEVVGAREEPEEARREVGREAENAQVAKHERQRMRNGEVAVQLDESGVEAQHRQ